MSIEVRFLVLLVAFVLLLLAGLSVVVHKRASLGWLGLAAFVLVPLWDAFKAL